jgi:hypothetical protein
MRLAAGVAGLALSAGLLAGCGHSYDSYCGAVTQRQQQLTQALAGSGTGALVAALPAFESLRDQAPDDIRGSWDQLVSAVTGVRQALQAAGIDPATYDAAHLPASVTADQRARISAAATALESQTTLQAAASVEQEVRDVCHTPLSM